VLKLPTNFLDYITI